MKNVLRAQITSNEHPFTKRLDGAFTEAIKGLNETLNKQTGEIVQDNLTRFSDLVQTMNTLLEDIHNDLNSEIIAMGIQNGKDLQEIKNQLADLRVKRHSDSLVPKWQQFKKWATTFEIG